MKYLLFLPVFVVLFLCGCGTSYQTITYNEPEHRIDSLKIHEGILSTSAQKIRYKKNGKTLCIVELSEPVMVAIAEREEKWGFFQFPTMYRSDEGVIIVGWQLNEDTPTAYGIGSSGQAMSKDEGLTWSPLDKRYFYKSHSMVECSNGDILQVNTPTTKNIKNYQNIPTPVNKNSIKGREFYLESELPEDFKGVYFHFWKGKERKYSTLHASLNDPGLLRDANNGLMPVVWWGDIKELADGSIVAGVYPCYYRNSKGEVLRNGVSFYISLDHGAHWNILGKIPYQLEGKDFESFVYDTKDGFTEPAFEILKDSTFLCVMRTDNVAPMYKSISKDKGKTWTIPEPFTPNGVKPQLLKLDNGVLALASGRPGIQVRFCLEGDGENWTEPIDMMLFLDEDGVYHISQTDSWTCGYPSMIKADKNSFYIVYSDFRKPNEKGEVRKAIMFRRIKVVRK